MTMKMSCGISLEAKADTAGWRSAIPSLADAADASTSEDPKETIAPSTARMEADQYPPDQHKTCRKHIR